jgi:hypothetical protein
MADGDLSRLTEVIALAAVLKPVVDEDRYPLSPRTCPLRGILAKPRPLKTGAATF